MSKCYRVICVVFLLAALGSAWGETITASDNAYVLNSSPYGDQDESESLLLKDNGGGGMSRLTYLRFDVSERKAQDTVILDLNLKSIAADARRMDLWVLNDGVSGETTWNSVMGWYDRPDGTGALPNENTTAVNSYGYNDTGIISIPILPATWQTILSGDSNGQITLILCNDANNGSASSFISSIGNTDGYLKPRLRVLRENQVEIIPESTYGGDLERDGHNSGNMLYHQTWITARIGTGGSSSLDDFNQMLFFQLPKRPVGGFKAEATSFRIKLSDEDVGSNHADLWGIGYVPAEDVETVGDHLNEGGVTDIDDFFLRDSDTETKVGWNIGTHNTQKIWDDAAGMYMIATLGSPPAINTNLTAFINDLFVNHGAAAGDYLVLRLNHDATMGHVNNWTFFTGNDANNKPVLTLSRALDGTVLLIK